MPKRDGRVWECEEKKIIVPIHLNLSRNREFQKNSKKLKKHQYGFFSSQNGTVEAENETKRKFSFWTIPTGPGRGNYRKIAKKIKKTSLWILFKPKQEGQAKNEREKNILVPIHSNTTRNREFQKYSKKIQKIKKHHYGLFPTQNGTGEAENMRKKNSRSDPFQPNPE